MPILQSITIVSLLGGNLIWWGWNRRSYLCIALITLVLTTLQWQGEMKWDSQVEGQYTLAIQGTIKLGMILFISREVMLFFRIFWAYFHYSLNPAGEIGFTFPGTGIQSLNPMALPLYNTLLLVRSGLTLTVCHNLLLTDNRGAVQYLLFTIVLGFSFTLLQGMEYYIAPFTFSMRNYGSVFYLGTGFHGAHVLIGATLLRVGCYKIVVNTFTKWDHTFLECAIWYWHFVDVVWLFLFVVVYGWGR